MNKEYLKQLGRRVGIATLGITVIGALYRLQITYLGILWLMLLIMVGRTDRMLQKKHRFDAQLEECGDYILQMCISFRNHGEILSALKESEQLFEPGEMKNCIQEIVEFLDKTYKSNNKEAGLRLIEERYPCKQIQMLHRYMLEVERVGGKSEQALKALEQEFSRWRIRVSLFQKECAVQRRNNIIAIAASMTLCASVVYLAPDRHVLLESSIYQIGTSIVLVLDMVLGLWILKKTIRNWIIPQREYTKDELEEKIVKYFNHKGRMGRRTLKRILQKEIQGAFPEWLLQLTILLQNADVTTAIAESERKADVVLKLYLRELLEKIHDHPDSPTPFLEFLGEFKTSESNTTMKMLYAISSGSCTDAVEQVGRLMERAHIMADDRAKKQQENIGASMYALFLLPTLLASLKLIMDMSVLLLSFTSQLAG